MMSTIFGDLPPDNIVEITVNFYQTTWAHIPRDNILQVTFVKRKDCA
jgi:hypothetical protein